ncbi:MAG: 3-deoxy-D-manno-octulosonic acid transferase, partial [Verrucomicrobia bacterium]
ERTKQVCAELDKRPLRYMLRSEITPETPAPKQKPECLLVNTTGELRSFYEHATVIFVGRSLTVQGGQNPIEPAALGKAIVFGPNMQNSAAIAEAFLKGNGAVQVRDAAGLEKALAELIADEKRRETLGQNALRVVRENRGAIERTVDMIVKHLEGGDLYVAPQW